MSLNTSTSEYAQPYLSKLAKSGTLMIAGLIFTNVASFLFTTFVARLLGPSDFGLFSLGFAMFGLASTISLLGLDKAVVHFGANLSSKGDLGALKCLFNKITKTALLTSMLISFLLFCSADIIVNHFFKNKELISVLRVYCFVIPFFVAAIIFSAFFQAIKDVRRQIMARNFIEPSVKLLGLFLLFFLNIKKIYYIIILILFSFFCSAFYSLKTFRLTLGQININKSFNWPKFKIISYSIPLLLTEVLNLGMFRLDIFFLGYYHTDSMVGKYSAAFQLSNLGILFLTAGNLIYAPYAAAFYSKDQKEFLAISFKAISRWILILTLPVLGCVFLFSREIMTIFGPEYVGAAGVLIILTFGQLVSNFCGISGTILMMSGYSKVVLANSILTCLVSLLMCGMLVPNYRIAGAAFAAAITISFLGIIRLLQTYRLLKITPFSLDLLKPIVAIIITIFIVKMVCVTLYQPAYWFEIIIIFPVMFIIYIATIIMLGLNENDKKIFSSIVIYLRKIFKPKWKRI